MTRNEVSTNYSSGRVYQADWSIIKFTYIDIKWGNMLIRTANDLVENEESVVVVFTKGEHLRIDDIGNGETGYWVVNPDRLEGVSKVMIYLRDEKRHINRIFLGNYRGVRKSTQFADRQIIGFSKMKEVATTMSNWIDFAGGGQNPVAFVGGYNISRIF